MTPLLLYDITVGGEENIVGIFGCTLLIPSSTESLLSKSQRLADDMKATLQLVDAERIASPLHLLFATHHALQAFHQCTQRANTVGMELLRYAASQRQITRALDILGVTDSTTQVGGVLLGGSQESLRLIYLKLLSEIGAEDTPQVLEINSSAKAEAIQLAFDLGSTELEAILATDSPVDRYHAITKLVYERCALLAIEK